jgi:hypothetical protein
MPGVARNDRLSVAARANDDVSISDVRAAARGQQDSDLRRIHGIERHDFGGWLPNQSCESSLSSWSANGLRQSSRGNGYTCADLVCSGE